MSFWVAGAAAVIGTVAGAAISADASRSAANKQADAARAANDTQMAMFQQNKADLAPWMQGGQQGLQAMLGYTGVGPNGFDPNAPGVRPFGLSDLYADPGYISSLKFGKDALFNRHSAFGGVASGNTLRDLVDYGSLQFGVAKNRYDTNIDRVYGRMLNLSNTGVNAAGGIAGLGAGAANQISGNQIGIGNALAAGQVGQANAVNSSLSGGVNNWLLARYLQQRGGVGGGTGSPWTSGFDLPMGATTTSPGWTSGFDLPMG